MYFLTNGILAACVLHGNITKTFSTDDSDNDDSSSETSTGTVATRVYMIVSGRSPLPKRIVLFLIR